MTSRLIGVSFDFYDTLVEIDRDVPTIAEALSARGFPCSARVEAIWNSPGFDGQATSTPGQAAYDCWRAEAMRSLVELCGAPAEQTAEIVAELLALDRSWTVKRRPGVAALLASLAEHEVACCILTNWDYPLDSYLAMAKLPADLPAITSAMLGVRKPHAEAFAAARALLGVAPEAHIHIGDNWGADVAGAVRSGAWAIWVNDKGQGDLLPTRIRHASLAHLPAVLYQLIDQLA